MELFMTKEEFLEFAGLAMYAEQELFMGHGCASMVITDDELCGYERDDMLNEYRKIYET